MIFVIVILVFVYFYLLKRRSIKQCLVFFILPKVSFSEFVVDLILYLWLLLLYLALKLFLLGQNLILLLFLIYFLNFWLSCIIPNILFIFTMISSLKWFFEAIKSLICINSILIIYLIYIIWYRLNLIVLIYWNLVRRNLILIKRILLRINLTKNSTMFRFIKNLFFWLLLRI